MSCGSRGWRRVLILGVQFVTKEWSLETEDGRKIQLLDEGREDPFTGTAESSLAV